MAIEMMGAALRQIDRLFADGAVTGLSDAQLLERFVGRRDVTAFEAIVARHGPMVLSVCRGILRDPNDAEDAFQAVFLVLVKKAGSIRGRVILGGWLYRVAHRVAVEANLAAARRRARERQVAAMAAVMSPSAGPPVPDDLLPALHEEIARLPEKYRLPVVLCDLEGIPQAEAAGHLRWSERTLRRRLAEARDRLKGRLERRGLAPDGAALGTVFVREARAAVPPAWNAAAVRAAMHAVDPSIAAGTVSAAAQSLTQEVLRTMLVQKLTIASAALIGAGMLAWAASAALVIRGDEPGKKAEAPTPTARQTEPAPDPQLHADPLDPVGFLPVAGRVLDPDGQPVAGAGIYIWHYTAHGWDPSDPVTHGQRGRVAVSERDGRFHFNLDKSSSDWAFSDTPAWHEAQIAAVAPGYGPAWIAAGSLLKGGEATLRLVRDDVPIRGRVLDLQGRPLPGVTVRASQIAAADAGTDLDAMLAAGEMRFDKAPSSYRDPSWLDRRGIWTTDADGRFEIRGVGRDRMIGLEMDGPGLAHVTLYATARPSRTAPKPRPRPSGKDPEMMLFGPPPPPVLYGATFEQIIGPSKPIIGVVRTKGTGRPAAGVNLTGIEPTTWTWVHAMTDKEGRFRLLGLPKAGVYRVDAGPRNGIDPYLGASITVSDTEGLKPIETTLEVPRGVVITGRLIDGATGRPVRAKHVTYVKLPTNPNEGGAATGHSGLVDPSFRMTVPSGEGLIYANLRGQETPFTRARLRKEDKGKGIGGPGDGETTTILLNAYNAYKIIDVPVDAKDFKVDLVMIRGLTLKGRVVDPDGKPVTGVRCYGLSSTWGFIKTLPDGTFEAHGLEPGHPRQLSFAHKERRLVGAVIIKDEDLKSEAPLEVRLGPPGTVKGRLVDEDGLPLAGATLSVMSVELNVMDNLPPGQGALWPDDETFTADSDGRFEVVGLKPGVKCFIGVNFKTRPNTRVDTGQVFRGIAVERLGEIRDLGDVKVKVVPDAQ